MPQFDMSCMACCGCCADIPDSIEAIVGSLGDCCDEERVVGISRVSDHIWEGNSITTDAFCSRLDVQFVCYDPDPQIQIVLRLRGNFGACDQTFDSGVIDGSCTEPWGYVEFVNGNANCCGGIGNVLDVTITDV
jgi:hypothetical protein